MEKSKLINNLLKIANELDLNGETEIADEITKVAVSLSNIREAQQASAPVAQTNAPVDPVQQPSPAQRERYNENLLPDKAKSRMRYWARRNPSFHQTLLPLYQQAKNIDVQAWNTSVQIKRQRDAILEKILASQPQKTTSQPTTTQPVAPQTPAATTPQAQPPRA